jgi:hypothetical protein
MWTQSAHAGRSMSKLSPHAGTSKSKEYNKWVFFKVGRLKRGHGKQKIE